MSSLNRPFLTQTHRANLMATSKTVIRYKKKKYVGLKVLEKGQVPTFELININRITSRRRSHKFLVRSLLERRAISLSRAISFLSQSENRQISSENSGPLSQNVMLQ